MLGIESVPFVNEIWPKRRMPKWEPKWMGLESFRHCYIVHLFVWVEDDAQKLMALVISSSYLNGTDYCNL